MGGYMNEPRYLVEYEGVLYAYYTLSVLLCDLSLRQGYGKVYQAVYGYAIRYEPVTIEYLREKYASDAA
jgi:hypothetical protein